MGETQSLYDRTRERLDCAFQIFLKAFPDSLHDDIRCSGYFAGGAIVDTVRDETPRDYDVFFKDGETVKKVKDFFAADPWLQDVEIRAVTENAITVVVTVAGAEYVFQIVTRFFGTTDRVFKSFDFSHCMAFYQFFDKGLSYDEDLILNKKLVYNGEKDEYTLNTLKRLCKFVSRGWTPDNATVIALYKAIQKRPPLDDPEEHKAQSIGFYGSSFV